MFDLDSMRAQMREGHIDAWLMADFRGNNPVFWQAIGQRRETTRRIFLCIPQRGEPRLLVHRVDMTLFTDLGIALESYIGWEELREKLAGLLSGATRVAMEYSPGGALPIMSWVDGGTLDLLRGLGMEICSSAGLYQAAAATWSAEALDSHLRACREVAEVKDAALALVRGALRAQAPVSEYDVQEFVMHEFQRRALETWMRPIVAVNEHASDLHYQPTAEVHAPIRAGDCLLLDLWARYPGEQNVYADITWVAYAGTQAPPEYGHVFDVVAGARDQVVARLQQAWQGGERLQGWELDRVARAHITEGKYGAHILHRTGHSLGPGPSVHGLGMNLDDLETHDTRLALPGAGFTIEPGVYLPQFGVRSEINVFIDPQAGPRVTTPVQSEIVLLG
jgi:Xaa-Pro dipeptidase